MTQNVLSHVTLSALYEDPAGKLWRQRARANCKLSFGSSFDILFRYSRLSRATRRDLFRDVSGEVSLCCYQARHHLSEITYLQICIFAPCV